MNAKIECMEIRYGIPEDAAMLAKIGAKTFYDAYIEDINADDLQTFVNETFSTEIQLKELTDTNSIFLIVEVDNNIAGYAKLTINAINEYIKGTRTLEVSRIYLLQGYIGRGIGKELMARAAQEAKERDCDSIWLGVWDKNQKAISFYEKIGFRKMGTHPFEFGDEKHNDLIMEMSMTDQESNS